MSRRRSTQHNTQQMIPIRNSMVGTLDSRLDDGDNEFDLAHKCPLCDNLGLFGLTFSSTIPAAHLWQRLSRNDLIVCSSRATNQKGLAYSGFQLKSS